MVELSNSFDAFRKEKQYLEKSKLLIGARRESLNWMQSLIFTTILLISQLRSLS